MAHDDRVRVVGLEARRHAERQDQAGPLGGGLRTDGALGVARQLTLGDGRGSLDEIPATEPWIDGHSGDGWVAVIGYHFPLRTAGDGGPNGTRPALTSRRPACGARIAWWRPATADVADCRVPWWA